MAPQPFCCALLGDGANVCLLPAIFCSCTIAEHQTHRLEYSTSARTGLGPAGNEQPLVDVVVQNAAESRQVLSTKRQGNLLHDAVANRVGMPPALALYNLDPLIFQRRLTEGFDNDVCHVVLH